MTPPTHMILGYIAGSLLPVKKPAVRWACVAAGLIPDLPYIAQIAVNKVTGRPAGEQGNELLLTATQIAHSLPLALLMGTILVHVAFIHWNKIGRKFWTAASLWLGWIFCHITVDAFTHKGIPREVADYMWPWKFHLSDIVAFWNYRDDGSWMPKWQEFTLAICLFIYAWALHTWESEEKQSCQAASAD